CGRSAAGGKEALQGTWHRRCAAEERIRDGRRSPASGIPLLSSSGFPRKGPRDTGRSGQQGRDGVLSSSTRVGTPLPLIPRYALAESRVGETVRV
ncbi:hypothetical protein P7K49_025606, partial [Saguinus oedipus]